MKRKIKYGFLFFAVAASLYACSGNGSGKKAGLPSLRETYLREDKNPFGTYIAYKLIQQAYPESSIRYTRRESVEKTWATIFDTGVVYISISRSLYTTEADVEAVMDYVKAGNDMLLAAAVFDEYLLDRIGCKVANPGFINELINPVMQQTSLRLSQGPYPDTAAYSYYYYPFTASFSKLPQRNVRVLGYNSEGKPNFIVCFHGNGRLFLHCEPRAFSNYFLLQQKNYTYLTHLLGISKRSPQYVYWNDYYSSIRSPQSREGSGSRRSSSSSSGNNGSTLDGLRGGLWPAFWLTLLLLLLYILNGTKRKQRIIPERKPNENTTVTFAETVGLLYLQKKDNKNIAEKMITYFNEFIRNQYFLNTNHPDDEFITTLSRKSGVPKDKVEVLYRTIENTLRSAVVDDYQLLSLNQQIQNFYKYRN